MLHRRQFLMGGVAMAAAFTGWRLFSGKANATSEKNFPYSLTESEWREKLTPAQFRVLREEGTERAGTSPLNAEKRKGTYHCAGCDQAVFDSETKFESGTGWPSFYEPIEGAVGESKDTSFLMTRTEVHCSNCGGHLGHVFDDGPPPTGLRYCMNGVAMTFEASAEGSS